MTTATIRRRMFATASTTFVAVILVAGCGGGAAPQVASPTAKKPDTANVKIEGDTSAPVNKLAIAAIADLQSFWATSSPSSTTRTTSPSTGACTL